MDLFSLRVFWNFYVLNNNFSEFHNVTVTTNAEIYQVCLRLILRI